MRGEAGKRVREMVREISWVGGSVLSTQDQLRKGWGGGGVLGCNVPLTT